MSIAIFTSSVISFLAFTLILKYSGNFIITFLLFCIYGLCATPFLTVGLEYLTETAYPVKEGYISFIMVIVGTVYNFSLTYILGTISQKFGCDIMGYTITGLYLSGLICITLLHGKLKRIGIDSGTQVGDGSNAQVASRPTRETTENKY